MSGPSSLPSRALGDGPTLVFGQRVASGLLASLPLSLFASRLDTCCNLQGSSPPK